MEAPDQMPAINHSQQSLYSGNSCIQTRWICYRKSSTLMIPIKTPIIQSSIQIDSSRLGLRSLSEVTRFISTKLFFGNLPKIVYRKGSRISTNEHSKGYYCTLNHFEVNVEDRGRPNVERRVIHLIILLE